MYCPNCGKEVPDQAKFCGHCGSSIVVPEAPQPEVSQVPARKKSKTAAIVISLIAVLILVPLILFAVFHFLPGDRDPAEEAETVQESVQSEDEEEPSQDTDTAYSTGQTDAGLNSGAEEGISSDSSGNPDSQQEATQDSSAEEKPGMFLNLDGMAITAMAPFENGVGWIQYMKENELYTAAVETDGHVLFEIPGPVWYVSPFEDGAAYVVISDNATYYSNADPSVGCYEQVLPADAHEEIYDLSGNLLYSTASADADSGSVDDHIICAGDSHYVVLRHDAGLEHDIWQLGVIDKNGDILYDFEEYSRAGKNLLPTWRGKYSGTKALPNMYGAGYGNGNDGDEGDGFSRYIGEGVYYLTDGSSGVFYKPEADLVSESSGRKLLSDCYGDRVLTTWNGTYYIHDVYYNNSDVTADSLRDDQMYEDIGPGKIFRYDHFMPENLYYHDHAYYDMDMNRVIEIEEYTSLPMDGSVFHEGYALIFMVGKDGKTYVTAIDTEGRVQFEPIQAERTSGWISDGCFVVRTDTECAVYDIRGNYIRRLCSAEEGEYIRNISGGYVTVWGSGTNRIYAINP